MKAFRMVTMSVNGSLSLQPVRRLYPSHSRWLQGVSRRPTPHALRPPSHLGDGRVIVTAVSQKILTSANLTKLFTAPLLLRHQPGRWTLRLTWVFLLPAEFAGQHARQAATDHFARPARVRFTILATF